MDYAMKSPADERDWIFENMVHGPTMYYNNIPEKFSWKKYNTPPRHQGTRGTCGPFAATKISEINHLRKGSDNSNDNIPNWVYLSPEFIYFHRVNKPSTGMYGRDVFDVLRKYGTVPEEQYPYADADNKVEPPHEKLYEIAKEFKINNYARVKTIDGLKRAIIELGPCYIGLPMYNLSEKFWDKSCGEIMRTGHAACAYGFNKKGFKLINSWGAEWAKNGKTIFPYEDFDIHWEIWAPIQRME
jgi:C1A family cysteine protease